MTVSVLKRLERLERLENDPFEDVIYDEPRSLPSELSDQEYERFVENFHEPPEETEL